MAALRGYPPAGSDVRERAPLPAALSRDARGGLSTEQIAARPYLSVRTVEPHLPNTYVKLRVSGKAARAAAAARFSRSREPTAPDEPLAGGSR